MTSCCRSCACGTRNSHEFHEKLGHELPEKHEIQNIKDCAWACCGIVSVQTAVALLSPRILRAIRGFSKSVFR
jgi:hypothetical protein